MNNPYSKEFEFMFINDLNREIIETKNEQALRELRRIKPALMTVSKRFKDTFLNHYKERETND